MEPQNSRPAYPLRLIKVGIRGLKHPIILPDGRCFVDLDAYVHLPPSQKGIHMSRIYESVYDSINQGASIKKIEEFGLLIVKDMLRRHEYAETVEVTMRFPFFYDTTHESKSMEFAMGYVNVASTRAQKNCFRIGIKLEGMTVCPCAMETFREYEKVEGLVPSHTQRCVLTIIVESTNPIPLRELIEMGKEAFSSETINLLKRKGEYKLVKEGFENPMFVEDVVRKALYNVAMFCKLNGYPLDETEVDVRAESHESIHKFNAYASRKIVLRKLLHELSEWSSACS